MPTCRARPDICPPQVVELLHCWLSVCSILFVVACFGSPRHGDSDSTTCVFDYSKSNWNKSNIKVPKTTASAISPDILCQLRVVEEQFQPGRFQLSNQQQIQTHFSRERERASTCSRFIIHDVSLGPSSIVEPPVEKITFEINQDHHYSGVSVAPSLPQYTFVLAPFT